MIFGVPLRLQAQNAPANPAAKAPEEVSLEINVVQIILNDEHRDGIDWGAIVSDYNTAVLKKENDPLWNDKRYRLSFGTLSEDDYAVLLDALDMAGEVTQLQQPDIKVTAGTPAVFSFDKENIRVNLDLSHAKTGDLSLSLSPHLSVATTEIFNGENVPSTVVLAAQTDSVVANNTTIVIGGFIKEQEIKRWHKIPVLGDIPIFGLVFRSHGHLVQKTETVIFLTEHTNAVEAPQEEDSNLP